MAPHLTITPDPPVHGQSLLICTQANTPQTVTITVSGSAPVQVVLKEACNSWYVPDDSAGKAVNFHAPPCPDISRTIA